MPSITDSQFITILNQHGQRIIYWAKSTGSADPFATGSTTTYGYGDPETVLTSGSFNAVIMPAKIDEDLIEPGYIAESYRRLFIRGSDTPEMMEYVTFDGTAWQVQPRQSRLNAGSIIFQRILVRRLIPSGSLDIAVKYQRMLNP